MVLSMLIITKLIHVIGGHSEERWIQVPSTHLLQRSETARSISQLSRFLSLLFVLVHVKVNSGTSEFQHITGSPTG